MANAVRFHEIGGPEVLKFESVAVPQPGPGEVHIQHAAVGLNYADTYFRTGYYPAPLPNGIGVEAAGTILAVGPGVNGFTPGDRVTYTGSPLGAYSTERVMPVGLAHQAARYDRLRNRSGNDDARPHRGVSAAPHLPDAQESATRSCCMPLPAASGSS